MHLERITVDPERMGGLPCIRDLRVTVAMVLGQLAAGRSRDEILADYPYLEADDITLRAATNRHVAAIRDIGAQDLAEQGLKGPDIARALQARDIPHLVTGGTAPATAAASAPTPGATAHHTSRRTKAHRKLAPTRTNRSKAASNIRLGRKPSGVRMLLEVSRSRKEETRNCDLPTPSPNSPDSPFTELPLS